MKNSQSRTGRKPVLNSIGLAVVATLIASGAHAASTVYDFVDQSSVEAMGHQTNVLELDNAAAVSSSVSNGTFSNGGTTSTGSTYQVGNNIVAATAIANQANGLTIDLSLIQDSSAKKGVATLLRSIANAGNVNSLVQDNMLSIVQTDLSTGSAFVNNNAISANTMANQGISTISGVLPNGYTSATPGSTKIEAFNSDTPAFSAAGSIVVSTAQQANAITSEAKTSSNTIKLQMESVTTSGAAITGNAISATNKTNSAANTIAIESMQGNPTFTGSAVVANTQVNDGVSARADNVGSVVQATINSLLDGGGLTVTGNNISSSSTANDATGTTTAGNRIVLADGLSFTGASIGADPSVPPGATLMGNADGSAAAADLLIVNTQSNRNPDFNVNAIVSFSGVSANLLDLKKSNIDLSKNSISTSSTANAATSAIAIGSTSVPAARFAGSVALVNQQDIDTTTSINDATVRAQSLFVSIESSAADVNDSTLSTANNVISASGRGNTSGQTLDINANEIAFGNNVATLSSLVNTTSSAGAATLSNRQVSKNAPVLALIEISKISQDVVSLTDSTSGVNANTQQAVALSNNASNAITLVGNSVDSGVGILSKQLLDNSDTTASIKNATTKLAASGAVMDSAISLTNNAQQAIGLGNLSNNTLSVTGTSMVVPATNTVASTVTYDTSEEPVKALGGVVVAAYGVVNDQSLLANVKALATTTATAAADLSALSLNRSTATNNGNKFVAEALGNVGSSSISLSPTNLSVSEDGATASVANVTSFQALSGAITAQASVKAVTKTAITGKVENATVLTNSNMLNAQATGSDATNALMVAATNLSTGLTAMPGTAIGVVLGSTDVTALSTSAAFSLQNTQLGQGSVLATLRDNLTGVASTAPSDVRIAIGDDVTNSTVQAVANMAMATATSNSAANALALKAASTLASSSALQNVQTSAADVSALIGAAGVAGSPAIADQSFNAGASTVASPKADSSYNGNTGDLVVSSGKTVTFSTANAGSQRGALEDYLETLGFAVDRTNRTASVSGQTVNLATLNAVTQTSNNTDGTFAYSFAGFTIPGTPAVPSIPNLGGVNLAIGGALTNSTLSVTGNTTQGLAEGNRATNSTSIAGNAIAAASNLSVASISDSSGLTNAADHALTNLQAITGTAAIRSDVYGSFAITSPSSSSISGSTLSVSGNTQRAEARANTAVSSLSVSGTEVLAVSALQSTQESLATVSAASDLELFGPGALSASSLQLSNNNNIALAVINDASNSLAVKGSKVGTGQQGNSQWGDSYALTAENLVDNLQNATTAVTSTATTRLFNQEAFNSTGASLVNSTVSILGNLTAAESTANKALNTATVTGTASQVASVALRNVQTSAADVTASATSAVQYTSLSSTLDALNGNSVLLNGNSTTALARGNTASNVLNSVAGSAYGTALDGSVSSSTNVSQVVPNDLTVKANAGILNHQTNSGIVSASSQNVGYQVALNSDVSNSNVGVTGNQIAAQAYGNSAVNQLSLNALNTGVPTSAVGNYQRNSGAVTATASNVNFGSSITAAASASTMRATGNQITATAVGNSVASSILAAAR